MKYEINMPKFGATMEDGEIVEWYVKVGDAVKKGDKLCSIMTEKLTNDLEAMHTGTVAEIVQKGACLQSRRWAPILFGGGAESRTPVQSTSLAGVSKLSHR